MRDVKGRKVTQPLLFPEYKGARYTGRVTSAGGVALVKQAITVLEADAAGIAKLLHFAPAPRDRLLTSMRKYAANGEPTYLTVQTAKLVLLNNHFHVDVGGLLAEFGEVHHGAFKLRDAIGSKIEGEYIKMTKPECRFVKDQLRLTVYCDDHRALERADAVLGRKYKVVVRKNRLGAGTHDVLIVIVYEDGMLGEVQLTFRTVALMKAFSHSPYAMTRIKTDTRTAAKDILVALFTIPRWGGNFAGGYSERSTDEIQLNLKL